MQCFFFRWFSFRNCVWLFYDSSHSFSGIFNLLNLFPLADTIFTKDQLIDAKLQSFDPDKQSPHPVESGWKMSKPSWSEVHAANFSTKAMGSFSVRILWHHRQPTANGNVYSQPSSKQTRETNMTVKQILHRSRKHELSRPDKWLMLVGYQVICYWGPRGNPETPRRSPFNRETAQLWMFLHRDKPFGYQLPVTNLGRRKMVKRSWVEQVCKADVNIYKDI